LSLLLLLAAASPLSCAPLPDMPGDLVPQARVTASSSALDHPPQLAADRNDDTYWEAGDAGNGWIEFNWAAPVTVREFAVKRIAGPQDKDAGVFRVEAFDGGAWRTIWNAQPAGGKQLPLILLGRVAPARISRLRISGLAPHAMLREFQAYSRETPPFLDVRGDPGGNIIGVLTDAFGASGLRAQIRAHGTAGGQPWTATVSTDETGYFRIPIPAGLSGPVEFVAERLGARQVLQAGDLDHTLVPRPAAGEDCIRLDGKWRFLPDPPAGFESPDQPDAAWAQIHVPAHWVMKGFHAEHGAAAYRKRVAVPASWSGRRVRLAFDGVYSGAEVWWNGRRVGSHTGGATGFQLDVTEGTHFGASNLLAVRVTEETMASELDHMSVYADFSLAGIFRAVRLFSVPETHVERWHSFTQFDPGYRSAWLVTEVTLVNESSRPADARRLTLSLTREGRPAARPAELVMDLPPWGRLEKEVRVHVDGVAPWSAEHPNLYMLEASIRDGSSTLETVTRATGFRETRIEGTRLLVNGVAVKLKGTCHHDSHPTMGRAVTPELERRDLSLMKEANLDALRTSHYPPIPELLDAADELGVYVEEEAPFCWVDNSSDLRYSTLTRQLTSEMVERDRSHPSVTYWSAGNESTWGPILSAGESMIRDKDPTRPVVGSWSDHFDMEIHHNPITVEAIRAYESHTRPVIWDESLCIFQGIFHDGAELFRDPGYRDYYVAPLIPIWDALWHSKVTQGSFIWAWSDDLFAVPGRASEYGRHQTLWHGPDREYTVPGAGLVGDAPWGVVDGWRRKKPEFWHVKKLHSPVHIEVRGMPAPPDGVLRIPVENRYFFTNLSELSIDWSVGSVSGQARANVPPQSAGIAEIRLPHEAAGGDLDLKFRDARGRLVDAFRILVGEAAPAAGVEASGPLRIEERRNLADDAVRVVGDGFEVAFSRTRGLLRYALSGSRTVLYAAPHVRVSPIPDTAAWFPQPDTWRQNGPLDIGEDGGAVTATVRGAYPNLSGVYRTTITRAGDVSIEYAFVYGGPDVRAREIGLHLSTPLACDTLEWTRRGEWTWYPEDHIGAVHGVARAHSGHPAGQPDWAYGEDDSALGTNAFRSTKRNFLSAFLRDAAGAGLEFESGGSQHFRATVEPDRIAVQVSDWFGGTSSLAGEWTSNYGDGKVLHAGDEIRGVVRLRLKRR
jgi:beta-galactosidase